MDVSCCGSSKVNAGVSFQSNPTCAGGLYASMVCTLCADTIAVVLAMVLPRVWLVLSCFSLSLSLFLFFLSHLFLYPLSPNRYWLIGHHDGIEARAINNCRNHEKQNNYGDGIDYWSPTVVGNLPSSPPRS